jgi:preprotein translocase subunit YajC
MPIFAQAAPGGGGMGGMLLTFGLMFAVMYFLIIRPQQKRQKEHQKMLDAVKKGDRVVTNGGLHGVVKDVRDDTLLVKIAENTVVELSRGALASRKGGDSE